MLGSNYLVKRIFNAGRKDERVTPKYYLESGVAAINYTLPKTS